LLAARQVFDPKQPARKLKKIAYAFERLARLQRPIIVGAVIPPHQGYIRRERPSTPSAHMA
jgi:hypothetical protein